MSSNHLENGRRAIQAIKVRQWLRAWDEYDYNPDEHRARPEPHFYLFALPASDLQALSGVYPRTTRGGLKRHLDLGIQRAHDQSRSDEINEFVQFGYPWSQLSSTKRESGDYNDLRKPGWLPTAIVVNILTSEQERRKLHVAEEDLISVNNTANGTSIIRLPAGFSGLNWRAKGAFPIEVIDGQHRLRAFERGLPDGDFELPVVAFHGLDLSWQAYLFWTINITPKRINASLAFDLYPLLRSEDWLERFEGPAVYRETRAQELVETLWSYPESPWYQRINMLGEPGHKGVTQAAWIRSLLASYIKSWEGRGVRGIGGLFGAKIGRDDTVLPWSRTQQSAFLIYVWQEIRNAVTKCEADWASSLRTNVQMPLLSRISDPAFEGDLSLLNTDQGVRGVLYVTNDLFFVAVEHGLLDLESWSASLDPEASGDNAITEAIKQITNTPAITVFMGQLASGLAKFDWRTAKEPNLTDDQKTLKLAFRGSGGYKELRRQLLKLLIGEAGDVGRAASIAWNTLGF